MVLRSGCVPLHSHVWHSKNGPHDPWSWELWVESTAGLGAALEHMMMHRTAGLYLCAHPDTDQEHTDHAGRMCWVGPVDPSPLDIGFFPEAPPHYQGPRRAARVSSKAAVFSMGQRWPRRKDGTVEDALYGRVDRAADGHSISQSSSEAQASISTGIHEDTTIGSRVAPPAVSALEGRVGSLATGASLLPVPPLFLPHGSPPIPIERCASEIWLRSASARLPFKPKAIIFMSPHFSTEGQFAVSTSASPQILYDFDKDTDPVKLQLLQQLRYQCSGAPEIARRVAELLRGAGLACDEDGAQGLDHGVWTPLYVMFPAADVPVCCVSVRSDLSAQMHLKAGRALHPLVAEGVLICGSGEVVHNVPLMGARGSPVATWCSEFEGWLESTVGVCHGVSELSQAEQDARLIAWQQAPGADIAHPADSPGEHLMPFFFAYGAAGEGVIVRCLHKEYLGSLPMAAYEFQPLVLSTPPGPV